MTAILIALNCGVYWFATSDPVASYTGAVLYGLIPYEVTHAGMQCVPLTSPTDMFCGTPDQVHAYYPGLPLPGTMTTIVSSMFLHGGLGHLAGNMLYLFVFGRALETALGRLSFVMVYLLSGVAAELGQTLWNTSAQFPMVGASGAIAGVMGAYLLLFPGAKVFSLFIIIPCRPRAFWVIGSWILLQFYLAWQVAGSGVQGGVAVFAHIAGFAAGMGLAYYAVGSEQIAKFRKMAAAFSSDAPISEGRRERVPVGARPEQTHVQAQMAPPAPAPGQQYVAPRPVPGQQYVAPPAMQQYAAPPPSPDQRYVTPAPPPAPDQRYVTPPPAT